MNEMIENKTFDEIRVGQTASLSRTLHSDDGETWAALTGDVNLIDLDPSPADSSMFPYGGGQAMWAAALFSTVAGTRLPGLGSLTTAADIHFIRPVRIGQRVTATVTVKEKRTKNATVVLDCACTDDSGQELLVGTLGCWRPGRRSAMR